MTIELNQLRSFLALAEELHFGRAANRLNMTQSALSQQISKLEEEIGVRLFRRERQVGITQAGEALKTKATPALEMIDQAVQLAKSAGAARTASLAIGFVEFTILPFLAAAIFRFGGYYPDAIIDRHEMRSAQQLQALRTGRIDVGIGLAVAQDLLTADLRARLLLTGRWEILIPPAHRFAQCEAPIGLAELSQERLILFAREVSPALYDGVVQRCRVARFEPDFVYETRQSSVGFSLLAQKIGVMIAASYVIEAAPAGWSAGRSEICPILPCTPIGVQGRRRVPCMISSNCWQKCVRRVRTEPLFKKRTVFRQRGPGRRKPLHGLAVHRGELRNGELSRRGRLRCSAGGTKQHRRGDRADETGFHRHLRTDRRGACAAPKSSARWSDR